MNQHEAGEVVIRILGDVTRLTKAYNQGTRQTEKFTADVSAKILKAYMDIEKATVKNYTKIEQAQDRAITGFLRGQSKMVTETEKNANRIRRAFDKMNPSVPFKNLPKTSSMKWATKRYLGGERLPTEYTRTPKVIKRYLGGESLPTAKDYSRAKRITEKIHRDVDMAAKPSIKSTYATSRKTQSGMGKEAEAAFDAIIRSGRAPLIAGNRAKSIANRMIKRGIPKGSMNAVGLRPGTLAHNAREQAKAAAQAVPETILRSGFIARAKQAAVRARGATGMQPVLSPTQHTAAIITGIRQQQEAMRVVNRARIAARAVPEVRVAAGTVTNAVRQANRAHNTAQIIQAVRQQQGAVYLRNQARMVPDAPLPASMQNALDRAAEQAARRAQAARNVVDRPLDTKYAARLASARQLGGPLSPIPGILGKIAGGFIEASKKKDAFAANVFAKMPPCFFQFMNVAKAVYRIGTWGFNKAWEGAKQFGSYAMSIPGRLVNGFNSVSRSIRDSIGNLQAFGTKLRTAGIYTTAAITAPLVAMGVGTVAEGASFDKATTETVARAGADSTGRRLIESALRGQMEVAAIKLSTSGDTSFSPTELAKGYTELAAAGVKAKALIDALPITAALAQAGELDLAVATNALTTTMGAFGETSTKYENDPKKYAALMKTYSDAMVTVSNVTQASVESVAQSMTSDAGPAAKRYGMSIQELSAIIGVYAEKGYKGAKAGSMAGRALRLVAASFARHKGEWKRQGIEVTDATGAYRPLMDVMDDLHNKMQWMSPEAGTDLLMKLGLKDLSQKSITPLIGARKEYDHLINEMKNGDATAKMAAIQMEAFSNQIAVMWNNIRAVKIDLFKILAPYLLVAAEAVNEMTRAFRALSPATKKSIVLILSVVALVGPILLGLGTMVSVVVAGFSLLAFILAPIAMLLTPITAVVLAATALGVMWLSTLKIDLVGMWNRASAALNRFAAFAMGFMRNFGPNMAIVLNWLKAQWTEFGNWSAGVLNQIGMAVDTLIAKYLPSLLKFWEALKGGNFFAGIGDFFKNVVGFIVNLPANLETIFAWIKANFDSVGEYIYQLLANSLEILGRVVVRIGKIIGDTILQTIAQNIVAAFQFMMDPFDLIAKYFGETIRFYVVEGLREIMVSMQRLAFVPEGVARANVDRLLPSVQVHRGPLDDLLDATKGDVNRVNPVDQAIRVIQEEKARFDRERGKLNLPAAPQLNLGLPNLQGPQLQPRGPVLFEEDRRQGANNTKLFEMMVQILEATRQDESKKPRIMIAPAGIA